MTKVTAIVGVSEAYAFKLRAQSITTVDEYLKKTATKQGRAELAEKTGIADQMILTWANHADLFRIKGIGGEYAELLEMVGVDTVPELAGRRPDNLYVKMAEINKEKKLVRRLPTINQLIEWIGQAKDLPRVMQY
jgi:predicted flap endonuclease-1-like 5' DNA nuclease